MAFRVEVSPRAMEDLDLIAAFLEAEAGPQVAEGWFNSMVDAILTLKKMPGRCQVAQEVAEAGEEIRVLLHGRRNRAYRIYFQIKESTVQILHVRHWARQAATGDELQ